MGSEKVYIVNLPGASMHIFICCSKYFYDRVPPIQAALESQSHTITLPNSFDDPLLEERIKKFSLKEHLRFKREMFQLSEKKIRTIDAMLILNCEKKGQPNYIGGATFLEMYDAWKMDKKLFLYNPIPDGMLCDEITGMHPLVINGDLSKIV